MMLCVLEALVVVRDCEHHVISEALERLLTRHALQLKFMLCDIPDITKNKRSRRLGNC